MARHKKLLKSLFSQKGFSHVELFIAIVFIGIIAFIGARVIDNTRAANSNGPLYGVSVGSGNDLANKTAQFGHLPIIRYFYSGLPASNAWTTGIPGISKTTVIVSFKAQPSAITSGSDDAVLNHFFDTAPTGHTIYYAYFHEPEDNIAKGQFTLNQYKAAWTHIVTLADAAHNSDLHSILILQSYDLVPSSHRNWQSYMPSGGIISTLGWDVYPQGVGCGCGKGNPLTPPAEFMGAAIAASNAAHLPFGYPEIGVALNKTTAKGRPAWLTSVGNYVGASGALFATYFDSAGQGGWNDELTDAASSAAWKAVIATSGTGQPKPQPAPVIVSLSATPAKPVVGNTSTLSWVTKNAKNCSLSPGGPQNTTATSWTSAKYTTTGVVTYTLSCQNSTGVKVSKTISVTVAPAPIPLPTVAITSPADNATVSGVITIGVQATNVTQVNIYWVTNNSAAVKPNPIRNATAENAYGWGSRWGTTAVPNGLHTVTVTAYNSAGKTATSMVTVNVQNPAQK